MQLDFSGEQRCPKYRKTVSPKIQDPKHKKNVFSSDAKVYQLIIYAKTDGVKTPPAFVIYNQTIKFISSRK
jgi:hypothetical protein